MPTPLPPESVIVLHRQVESVAENEVEDFKPETAEGIFHLSEKFSNTAMRNFSESPSDFELINYEYAVSLIFLFGHSKCPAEGI